MRVRSENSQYWLFKTEGAKNDKLVTVLEIFSTKPFHLRRRLWGSLCLEVLTRLRSRPCHSHLQANVEPVFLSVTIIRIRIPDPALYPTYDWIIPSFSTFFFIKILYSKYWFLLWLYRYFYVFICEKIVIN